jgi:hypothetical protein
LRIFPWGKKKIEEPPEDTITAAYANTAVNQVMAPRSPGERGDRRELGTDIYMLEATKAINVIESLAYATRTVTRQIQYEDQGITKLRPEVEIMEAGKPWAKAILIFLDTIWPTIWMTPYEADTKKLMLRTEFYKIKKTMSQNDREVYGVVVNACMHLCIARLEDCKDGHKDLIVKVDSHRLEVSSNRSLTNNAKTS